MQYRGAVKHLHTHVLLYCILVYSCTCLKRVGHCTEMWHSYTSVYTYIFLFPCVLSIFIFFLHPFLCKRVALFFFFLLLVTNLLINCEDVSCPLTCAQITSWFFWVLSVCSARVVKHLTGLWGKRFCWFLYLIFYSSRWSNLGFHFLTPRCHKVKTASSLKTIWPFEIYGSWSYLFSVLTEFCLRVSLLICVIKTLVIPGWEVWQVRKATCPVKFGFQQSVYQKTHRMVLCCNNDALFVWWNY